MPAATSRWILAGPTALIADIGTTAINTASGAANPTRNVFRISAEQATEQGTSLVIGPLSSEVARQMEANHSTYAGRKAESRDTPRRSRRAGARRSEPRDRRHPQRADPRSQRAHRPLRVRDHEARPRRSLSRRARDAGRRSGAHRPRRRLARDGDHARYPPAHHVPPGRAGGVRGGGDPPLRPHLRGHAREQVDPAMFNSAFAPKINGYLRAGNFASSYYATGNPSEPNYTALGGGDDFGITDDSQWNCDATGANAPQDLPLPDHTQPGLASSPFTATCTQSVGTNHNIVGKPNLFTAITSAGMTWRTYSESMNPGQDTRTDSVADAAITATDNVYAPGTVAGNTTAIGNPNLVLPFPAGLYKTKHHPGMAYQNVRSAARVQVFEPYARRRSVGREPAPRRGVHSAARLRRRPARHRSRQRRNRNAELRHPRSVRRHARHRRDGQGHRQRRHRNGERLQQRVEQRAGRHRREHPRARRQLRRLPREEDRGLVGLDEHPEEGRDRADVRRGQRDGPRHQLVLRLEGGGRLRSTTPSSRTRTAPGPRTRPTRTTARKPGSRQERLHRAHEPADRAERHRRHRRVQPLLLRPHASRICSCSPTRPRTRRT